MQTKLATLADQIGKVGMFSAALTFVAMLGHILYAAFASNNFVGHLLTLDTLLHLVDAFIVSVIIIVAAMILYIVIQTLGCCLTGRIENHIVWQKVSEVILHGSHVAGIFFRFPQRLVTATHN